MVGAVRDHEEVDDPGRKVEGHLRFAVDHCNAVPVPVAGPGHAATEQQEGRPEQQVCRQVNE